MARITSCFFLFVLFLASGCRKELSDEQTETGSLTLAFSSAVKTAALVQGQNYTNAWGETYSVATFKYYVHDIALVDASGKSRIVSGEYYLVDDAKAESKTIALRVPVGEYTRLTYTLGVDSARNVSGAQTGVLDPVNGMFWTWSSGYVMAKLEGSSPAAGTANANFSYHVGGFKQVETAIKKIDLPVPAGTKIVVLDDVASTVEIRADIDTWFGKVHPIKISENPACHSPGSLAAQIADNYAGMFQISAVR